MSTYLPIPEPDKLGFLTEAANSVVSGTKKAVGSSKQGTGTFLIPKSINTEQAVKGAAFVGTTLGELGLINKIKNRQQQRQMLSLNPVQTSVAPVQDMPAEVLNQRTNQIARLRSTYKGSDTASKLISDQMASAGRTQAMDQLASERGQQLIAERQRVAKEVAENQIRSGETANANIERAQTLNDYKLESSVNAMDQKKRLLAEAGKDIKDIADTSQAYGLNKFFTKQGNDAAIAESDYNAAREEYMSLLSRGDINNPDIGPAKARAEAARQRYNNVLRQTTPGYWTHRNGGKLIPRI